MMHAAVETLLPSPIIPQPTAGVTVYAGDRLTRRKFVFRGYSCVSCLTNILSVFDDCLNPALKLHIFIRLIVLNCPVDT